MKISKLLVLSALWLIGLNANAADLVERTAPELPAAAAALDAASFESLDKTPAPLAVDKAYVMYNVAAQKCYLAGNNYDTRASIGPWAQTSGGDTSDKSEYAAAVMYFTQTDAAKAQGDAVYELKSWVPKFSEFRSTFGGNSGVGDIWTDNNTRDDRFWTFADQGSNTYRISNVKNNTDYVLGWNGSESDLTLYLLDPATEGAGVDWQFFTVSDWDNYLVALNAYNAAPALKSTIETAEAAGFDVSAAVAVYNNLSATAEDINNAIAALNAMMNNAIAGGTADNPSIATSAITNPNFDGASSAGWSGTSPNMTGSGSHGPANVPEHYNKTFNTYQNLTGLPNGVYLLKANTFFRGGSSENSWSDMMNGTNDEAYPYLYAKAAGDTIRTPFRNLWEVMNLKSMSGATDFGTTAGEVSTKYEDATYYAPNDPSGFRLYEEAGYYATAVVVEVTDGNLSIGVRKDKIATYNGSASGSDWAIFDTFTLTYYGNTAASFKKAYEAYMSAMCDVVTLTTVTAQYKDTYQNALAAAVAGTQVGTLAEVLAAVDSDSPDAVVTASSNLIENMRLWNVWESTVASAENFKGGAVEDLTEYLEMDVPAIKEEMALTNDELKNDIQQMKAWIEQAQQVVTPGTDVTNAFLKNADCESKEGWEGSPVTGSGGGNTCFEKYGISNFDVYQIVTKAPKGVYSIEVQGFYRRLRPETGSYTLYTNGEQTPCGYVYMNNNASPLMCVYDDPSEAQYSQGNDSQQNADEVTLYYPNDMTSAAEAFAAGKYKSKAYGLVLNAGDELRIGVKGQENSSDWAIWDNFKLVYEGYAADVVKPVLEEEITKAKAKVTQTMGKDVKEALNAAIAAAESAVAGTDGEAMFNALAEISAINPDASIANFETLTTRNEELAAATAAAVCDVATITEASALNAEITTGIADGIYNDSDVAGLLEQIAKMIKKLNVPEGMDQATDENPVDATTMITNADYDKGNNDGWTISGVSPGFSSGLIEAYNANFDEYQDLEALREGTYEVSVQGFYRFGDGLRDDSTYVQDSEANNNLLLYVTVGEKTIAVPMPRLAKDGKQMHTSFLKSDDGKTFVAGDDIETAGDRWQWMWIGTPEADADSTSATGYRLANGLIPAATLFGEGLFSGTSIIFKVGAEGTARIGLKKDVQEANNWCVWDNWKLTYYGANSTKAETETGIANATAVAAKVEYFGLNGARISKPAKGIAIMRQTLSDGTVKTTKVIIK